MEFTEKHIPEDNPEVINVPANQEGPIDRVILAPEANNDVRSQVESDLEDADLNVPVVDSRLNSNEPPSRGYVARLAGADNYGGREDYLEGLFHDFVEETDWEIWETVDVVQLLLRRSPLPQGATQ